MIHVQGASVGKVRVTPLRGAATGPEWLPERNVNERKTDSEVSQNTLEWGKKNADPGISGCVKGAAAGMCRNNVAGPLWDVAMTQESDM